MKKPWQTIDAVTTKDGILELRQRGDNDFLILINGRVLMNSCANRSEFALGDRACREVADRSRPRVLIGGLGMGFTLRASLDVLPPTAQVIVAELNPVTTTWCRGPLAKLTNSAAEDMRVTITIDDVSSIIERSAYAGEQKFDAIIIDLYEGPHAKTQAQIDPFYGSRALTKTAAALSHGGILAVWGEARDEAFEKRLIDAGFSYYRQRPGRGGLRHVVYIAKHGVRGK
ncbi:MAG TPA: spermidine synthase [Nitrospirota bacterium]|nr:spermidine synthase [Nitrospirota bacterium]